MKTKEETVFLPAYQEIPDVGLFLEQTSKYVSGCLSEEAGIVLTPSMISNYVKQKLLAHPVKKQYSREQIAELLVISLFKTVLSLEEIRTLLDAVHIREETATVYETIRQMLGASLRKLPEHTPPAGRNGKKEVSADVLLDATLLTLAHRLSLSRALARF